MPALLRSAEEDTDRLAKLIDEVKMHGITVKVPDVNVSFEHIAAIDDHIQLGFVSIKGIWEEISQHIEHERVTHWSFDSLKDFLMRCSEYMNKKSLGALAKSWALDGFEQRATILDNTSRILDRVKGSQQQEQNGGWLFDMWAVEGADLQLTASTEYSLMEKLALEFSLCSNHLFQHIRLMESMTTSKGNIPSSVWWKI